MFEELLNKEVRAFTERATDKNKRWQRNVIATNIYYKYYVEYFEERLYLVYDYHTKLITMIYADSSIEAVNYLEYAINRVRR